MDQELLRRYLAGDVTETERQRCETLLEDPNTVVQIGDAGQDSLLEALQVGEPFAEKCSPDLAFSEDARLDALVSRIQRMIPRQSIGRDELERILDPPQSDDEIGRIGRYRVLEFVASGGMGLVFKAIDPTLDRLVCIKVMNPQLSNHGQAKQRFDREARAASRLQHERIVTVFEVGEHRELPFLVMQLLEGESLRRRLQRDRSLEPNEARRLTRQIAEGLRYAHSHGYLHRDIKPDNIWLTPDGNVKLLDLGLARAMDESVDLTHSGTVVGTPCYMSPEQVQSQPLAETSDLFSLGIVLYEMLTGISPFDRTNVFSTMMSVANDTLPVPTTEHNQPIPEDLMPLVRGLLEKQPENRIQTADEVIEILKDDYATGLVEPRRRPITRTSSRRNWIWVATFLLGAGSLGLAGFVYQTTDKGTLVIEADPDVDVSLSNQVVKIRDPKTEKTYTVKIGEQPLPSGVYQLELTDTSDEITLSSDVIVIRRGEQQLVRLTLRPPGQGADGVAASNPLDSGSLTIDSLIPELSLPPTDLSTIAPLDENSTIQALGLLDRKSLMPNATVSDPKSLDGVTSWTIEPSGGWQLQTNYRISADGAYVACTGSYDADNRVVRVLDDELELNCILPANDTVRELLWSPQNSVLAVLVHGDVRREALIWRVDNKEASLLRRIPVDATSMCWTHQGDQLFLQTDQGLYFYDVGRGRGAYHPAMRNVEGDMSDRAVSPDRQQIALTTDEAVQVWSLRDGNVMQVLPSASHASWLDDGNRLLVVRQEDEKRFLEVWNIRPLQRESRSLLTIPDRQDPMLAIDEEVRLFAFLERSQFVAYQLSGELRPITEQLMTAKDVREVVTSDGIPVEEFALSISAISNNEKRATILMNCLGALALYSIDGDGSIKQACPWRFPSRSAPFELLANGNPHSREFLSVYVNRWWEEPLSRPVQMQRGSLESPFSSSPWTVSDDGGFWTVSPRGSRYLLMAERDEPLIITVRSTADETELLRVPLDPGTSFQGCDWSTSDRFLVLFLAEGKNDDDSPRRRSSVTSFERKILVCDLESKRQYQLDVVRDGVELGLRTSSGLRSSSFASNNKRELLNSKPSFMMMRYAICGERVCVFLQTREKKGRFEQPEFTLVELYDLASGERIASRDVGPFLDVTSVSAGDDWVTWLAKVDPAAESDSPSRIDFSNRNGISKPYAIPIRSNGIGAVEFGEPSELPDDGLISTRSNTQVVEFSADGRLATQVIQSMDGAANSKLTINVVKQTGREKPTWEKVSSRSWTLDSGSRRFDQSQLTWHREFGVIAWRDHGQVHWLDTVDGEVYKQPSLGDFDGAIRPMDFGWLVQAYSRYTAHDPTGRYLGSWLSASRSRSLITQGSINCFIAADGTLAKNADATELRAIALRGNRVETIGVDEFLKEFPEVTEGRWPWEE